MITGSEEPTLPAPSVSHFLEEMDQSLSYTVPENENLYTMSVATGIKAGNTVEYFAIRYTDTNKIQQTKFIFPKTFSLQAANDYIKGLKINVTTKEYVVKYKITSRVRRETPSTYFETRIYSTPTDGETWEDLEAAAQQYMKEEKEKYNRYTCNVNREQTLIEVNLTDADEENADFTHFFAEFSLSRVFTDFDMFNKISEDLRSDLRNCVVLVNACS